MRIVAMISGTSHDAIDVAAADVTIDGAEVVLTPLGAMSAAYPADLRADVVAALPPAKVGAEAFCKLDTRLGQAFADAAATACATIAGGSADLVVSHGQTIFHWVEGAQAHGTLQLGQPAWIAERTGLPVVADLRSRDIAAGGHGAPLVSIFDHLLLSGGRAKAALNLGGIANITVLNGESGTPVAFDVGPANALMDAAMVQRTDGAKTYDAEGDLAAGGTVDHGLLDRLLVDPYYALEPPKTTGKEHFHGAYLKQVLADHGTAVSDADLQATLAELTARTVADACLDHGAAQVIAAGGGVRNRHVMRRLQALLAPAELQTIDRLGIGADDKEAYAFALMGFLTVNGLPGVVPSATGAGRATVLGAVVPGAEGRLPIPVVDAGWRPRRLRIAAG